MGVFFGTDGIRGVVNNYLTYDLAFKCGNAVATNKDKTTILIGGDTRTTRTFLTSAFSTGAMTAGADVIDIGVCTTPGIAYITEKTSVDFGAVVSASHNPAEYNGIKIFDTNGIKLSDKKEEALERKFIHETHNDYPNIGNYSQDFSLVKLYEEHLISCCKEDLSSLTILLDGSNGAAHKIAPAVFRALGAKVIATNCRNEGAFINDNCGSMHPEVMAKAVRKYKADVGFAFDGDADRIIACDENGNIIDGDVIIFMLAKYLKSQNALAKNTVVGTRHTNMGLEKDLEKEGIKLIRTDIGDKYVIAKMEEEGLSLGGEKSGHIIFREFASTGDGILSGIKIAEMMVRTKQKISILAHANLYPQCNIDCIVSDKVKIINSAKLMDKVDQTEKELGDDARIMVRVSGTEPKIRIMVECKDLDIATKHAKEIEQIVYDIDGE